MNAIEVKAEVASYLRFVRQYDLIAFEAFNQDILAVDGRRRLMWVEVKVSIGDLLNDRKKMFHQTVRASRGLELFKQGRPYLGHMQSWSFPARFFFAVPAEMAEKAHKKILELYPWAGLLSVGITYGGWLGHRVECLRKAEHIHDRKLQPKTLINLVRCQSASLANIYGKFARLQRGGPHAGKSASRRNGPDHEDESVIK
jgi:hypothetical protein